MSVDYSYGVAFGFILTADEYKKYIVDEGLAEGRLEDMIIRTDAYCEDGDYIYAFDSVDYGCVGAKCFNEEDLNTTVSQDELEEFWELFPHRASEIPSIIVYNQIW